MRWGVRDENTLDHQTWVACKRELQRCYKESAGLFFLSLQGDKYGYRPLPCSLDRADMETALASGTCWTRTAQGESMCSRAWRRWATRPFGINALPALRNGCFTGAEFGDGPELLVGQSVTEWEARAALALPGGAERSRWLHRRFDGGVRTPVDCWTTAATVSRRSRSTCGSGSAPRGRGG